MLTFTQLTGTTATTSPSKYGTAFTTLCNNNSASALAIGQAQIQQYHRYLLQKYFDNERTFSIPVVGGRTLTFTTTAVTLTSSLSTGATTAILSSAWSDGTGTFPVTFNSGETRNVNFTNGSTNITWTPGLTSNETSSIAVGILLANATSATMTTTWSHMSCTQQVTFSSGDMRIATFTNGLATITWNVGLGSVATNSADALGIRDYPIPANISKITNDTVTVGELVFQPFPVQSRQEWDMINTIPYESDIPNYFFIYGGTLGIWPIPSTDNNPLTFNYKARVPDLSFQDYSTGNVTAMTTGGFQITGTGTSWSTQFPLNVDVSYFNLMLRVDPPYGDGMWYPISSFQSDTALTLALPVVNAPNITSASTYTIGQMPLLQEDFQDMLVYGALMTYYGTIVKDPERFKMFETMYGTRLELMESYLGTKSVNVDLEDTVPLLNPNLMPFKTTIN